jgi:lambda family phage portal protein
MKILDVGYGEGGASRVKASMRGWATTSASPREDIDLNLNALRMRSRDLFMNSAIGRAGILTKKTNVIGPGLKLKSNIDYEFLGIAEDAAAEWQKSTEREWRLFSESKHCDSLEMFDFDDLQGLIFLGFLMNGDGWCVFQEAEQATTYMPYKTRLLLVEADRVSTPWSNQVLGAVDGINPENGNRIISGIELDNTGRAVATWICNTYPNNFIGYVIVFERKWTRIPRFGDVTGQPNVLQLIDPERAGQYRGVPYLAPIIETLKQLTRYTEAEIAAAVVSSFFTVFITSPDSTADMPLGNMIPPDARIMAMPPPGPNDYQLGPGTINMLNPDEKIEMADPKRPNSGYEPFFNAMCQQIGAALELPAELLLKRFTASYSASRGALLEAWKAFRCARQWVAKEYCQPVYEHWLSEAIAIGRVQAPGFFRDPTVAKAWSRSEWHGPAPGQLDPLKEALAADMRIDLGLTTRQREAVEINGSNFDQNVKELGREQQEMQKFGLSDLIPQAVPPKGGSNPEPQQTPTQNRVSNLLSQGVIKFED